MTKTEIDFSGMRREYMDIFFFSSQKRDLYIIADL